MPREIKKKILDKERGGSAAIEPGDQAQNLSAEMEAMAPAVSSPPRSGTSMAEPPSSSQGGKKLDSGFEFSLDDFDPLEEQKSLEGAAQQELAQTDRQAPESSHDERQAEQTTGKAQPRKIAFFAAICILPAILGIWALKHWWGRTDVPKPTVVTSLKRPIVIPHFKETLEFLVMTTQQNERSLMLLNLELGFSNEERHSRFMEEIVLVRDLIFNFLAAQRPTRNSEGDWSKIIVNDLTAYLKSATPQCRADSVRLNGIAKL